MSELRSTSSLDLIERLLRLAGPRPPVSEETTKRVKAVVQARWRQQVRAGQRARLKRLSLAALAAAAAVILSFRLGSLLRESNTTAPPQVARVERLTGPLRPVESDGRLLRVGDELPAGAEVQTSLEGRAALRLGEIALRVDVDTRLRLVSERVVRLEKGAVYVDTGDGTTGMMVETERGIVRDIGTRFEARFREGRLTVRVREGAVKLDTPGSQPVPAGFALTVDASRSELRPAPLHGPSWAWIWRTVPPFDIEGRTLGDFLKWIRRETGWTVRWSDPSLEKRSVKVVLHGSIDGLSPQEAVAAVLPTCGLDHRLEDGTLWVESSSSERAR